MTLLKPERHENPRGWTELENVAPGVVVSKHDGWMDLPTAQFMLDFDRRVLDQSEAGLWIFRDCGDLKGYDKGVRSLLTNFVIKNTTQFFRIEMFTRSKLVAMGLRVASLTLPNLVVHVSSVKLQVAIRNAIAERQPASVANSP